MARRSIIAIALGLALVFSPGLTSQLQARSTRKKPVRCSIKKKTSSRKKYVKSRRSKSRRVAHKRRSRRSSRRYSSARSSYRHYYRGGVAETPPLMKIIPQRDGRFILEPLSPKKSATGLSNPIAEDQKPYKGSRDDYSFRQERRSPISPRWSFRELVLAMAKQYRGTPYSLGASLEYSGATDCSGFVQYVYKGFQIDLPRCSSEQAQVGKTVTCCLDFSRLLPGDLLFFRRGGRAIGHSGIYLGEGKMIHASSHGRGVTITDLDQPYYINTFVVAKRVFEVRYPD